MPNKHWNMSNNYVFTFNLFTEMIAEMIYSSLMSVFKRPKEKILTGKNNWHKKNKLLTGINC